jgi:REP element-mobilizing transposase RayT
MLTQVFAIDLLAYAIMSNHYHVVLRINPDEAASWSRDEVVDRWKKLYSPPDHPADNAPIELWRERLMSLSWFMRAINEPLARMANREDQCKGRFWEGRFRSQALLDDTALLRCMAYVDLNPVRAGIAKTPESSSHTSVKARIEGHSHHLLPFRSRSNSADTAIPMDLAEYLQLVGWTGRAFRADKRGSIAGREPAILTRLGWAQEDWIKEMQYYGKWYYRAVGSIQALTMYCEHLGQQWLKGMGSLQIVKD